ncbi:DUF742 domain-containing protein [Streptomyces sp. NPDC048172]|uniref:DUF742 domain-containing protein n=1 Tax=Streptomyces sp. NPDC048172 TaxID=3365505 RepID=UPI00371C1622
MATPPGGPSSYGSGHEGPGGDAPFLNRFNFPSTPSEYAQPQQQPQAPQQHQPPQHHQHQHDPHQPQHHQRQPQAPRIQPVHPPQRGVGSGHRPGDQQRPPQQTQQPLVRPYAMTGGRTRPRYQLAIEALVHTSADPAQLQGQLPEHQRICRLCYEIKSVAEISALLTIPLGVARILVADLAEAGLVAIHQPGGGEQSADGQPDVTLLERVLSGLRKL